MLEGGVAAGEPGSAGGSFEDEIDVAENHGHEGEDGDTAEAEEGDGGVVDDNVIRGGMLENVGTEAIARDNCVVGGAGDEVVEALRVGDGDEGGERHDGDEEPMDDFGGFGEDEGEFEEEGRLLGFQRLRRFRCLRGMRGLRSDFCARGGFGGVWHNKFLDYLGPV